MKTKKTRTIGAMVAVLVAVGAGALTAAPAFAVDSRTGYIECNPNRNTSIASTTTTAGSPTSTFAVGHYVSGGGSASWSSAGYHSSIHGTPGGTWTISTTGTVRSGGAGCA